MKKIGALDVSVAALAAVSCLFIYIQVPVWGIFVGWAWYFALGATPDLIKKGILPLLAGAALAVAAFLLIDLFSLAMESMPATIISVFITVFLLMLTLKIPVLNMSLISFNGYSCIFVGYAAGAFLPIAGMPSLLNALIWVAGANFIGLLFGWLSIAITKIGKKNE
jgi:hypothetical protein